METRNESLDLSKIKIKDPFWSKHVDLVRDVIIPYQWDAMNDRIPDAESSHCLENFRIAAGLKEGEYYGAVFQDTDVAKWLEAVGFSLAYCKDEELERTADEAIDLIAQAQQEDGYINTYFTIHTEEKRWSRLCEGHELYTAGHLMEAAAAYYQGTGKRKLLDCMCRFADLICDTFGPEEGKIHGYPGHQEVEIGLVKLYRLTGERRYLDLAKYFIDARGVGENYFLKEIGAPGYDLITPEFHDYDPRYSQSHLPVRQQDTAEGHAVRAVYMYCAMADLAYEYQDRELMTACERIWDNMTGKRMYITGGIGSSGILERFTTDYDLPDEYNYAETCAAIGLALFGLRMAQITGKASYIDVVERALYNNILAGIALDGRSFFYVNPLEVWPDACMNRTSKEHVKPVRQKWFGVACCPPNIARTLASLGQYIYGWNRKTKKLYVNLFVSGEAELETGDDTVKVRMETEFPWKNRVSLQVSGISEAGIRLMVRIPDYAEHFCIRKGTEEVFFENCGDYAQITAETDGMYEISFEAPPQFVRANPKVRANVGRTAIVRGPLVYCLEEADNGENLSALYVDTDQPIVEEMTDLFGGSVILRARGQRVVQMSFKGGLYSSVKPKREPAMLTAVPYAYWNNRKPGEMTVWIKEL